MKPSLLQALHKIKPHVFLSLFSSDQLYSKSPQTTTFSTTVRKSNAMLTSSSHGKCSKIRHIVRLRQMLLRWRAKTGRRSMSPVDVPSGHVAVRVGPERRRFVVRAAYLNHPIFRNLLAQTEEEFGFEVQGPLTIPCDVAHFEDAVRFIARSELSSVSRSVARMVNLEDFQRHQRHCHVGFTAGEGRPLLQGLADKTVW